MRILRRILITVVVTLTVIFAGMYWVAPVVLSFYAARKVPPVARVVPTDLNDQSISEAPGKKLSYVGYEFEVPWNDLDEAQTKLYPKDKPEKTMADLRFSSGLRLTVSAIPSRFWVNSLATEFKVPPQRIESTFGNSDYLIAKTLYEFTPDKMHHWSLSQRVHGREEFLLLIKSVAPIKSAETGIFNLQNAEYKGFQEGNPPAHTDPIAVHLYADDGSVEILFFPKDYQDSVGVTQPEINRVVQSLRRTTPDASAAPRTAQN